MSNHLTLQKNEAQRRTIDTYLSKQDIEWVAGKEAWIVKQAKYRAVSITYYRNGKILLQGKELNTLLSEIGLPPNGPQELIMVPLSQHYQSIVGADESGKGDYFGPLVTAAVYVPQQLESDFIAWGVNDSKKLTAKKIDSLALQIMEATPYAVGLLLPHDYNLEYQRVGNLNVLLANLHAQTISKLICHQPEAVVVDQFAAPAVLKKVLQITCPLIQETKAESKFLAVAAASIVARWHFLQAMEQLSAQYMSLPRGATNVKPTARELVRQFGPEVLNNVAKIHFKTTAEVLQSL